MKLLNFLTILVLLLATLFTGFSCKSSPSLEISIISPLDGSIFRTNLIKAQISISEPNAFLKINSEEKGVISNGKYESFIQLQEGENKLVFSASWDKTVIEKTITVTFKPTVAICLDFPDLSQSIAAPFGVSGFVFPSGATVTVNGNIIAVNNQGRFITQVPPLVEGNNIIEATASFYGSEDTSKYTILVEDGTLTYPPGQGSDYFPYWDIKQSISVNPGQSIAIETNYHSEKSIQGEIPQNTTFKFQAVVKEYSLESVLLPAGINISLTPSTIQTYPNTNYQIVLTIQTTEIIQPDDYWIMLQVNNTSQRWIKISVLRNS